MDLLKKIKELSPREELLLAGAVFLMVTLAFGVGWLLGSRVYERPPIVVNCPAELYRGQ